MNPFPYDNMSANLEIQKKLEDVLKRIRKVQIVRGVLVTVTIFLAGLLLMMAADYVFAPLPGIARWVMFFVWIAATVYAGRIGFAPYFRKITTVQIARWIEVRHPEIQERMSTVLELEGTATRDSGDLIAALSLAAHKDIESVNPDVEIRSAQTRKKSDPPRDGAGGRPGDRAQRLAEPIRASFRPGASPVLRSGKRGRRHIRA